MPHSFSASCRSASPGRRNSIGALRLALASMVVFTHSYYAGGFGREWLERWSNGTMSAGSFAVQCFFVLSGWLVATSWCRQPTLSRFLWHRGLRLGPALWVCLAVTAFIFTPLLCFTARESVVDFFQQEPSAWGYFWRNLILPRTQIDIGSSLANVPWPRDWNGSLWTLFYEGACYLMVAGLGLGGLLSRWRGMGTVLIGGLLGLHVATFYLKPDGVFAELARLFDTPGKLLTLHFLAGAAWAVWPQATTVLQRSSGWILCGVAAGLVVIWHFPLQAWLSPFLLPPVILWASHQELLADFETWFGGDYSYGVYLYGYPVLQVLAHFRVHHLGQAIYLVASLIISLACAFASWHLIEKPALALKSLPWPSRPATAVP